MAKDSRRKANIGTIMLTSCILGFILDAFLVSNLMVIDGNVAVIIVGFILAILLFLLSLVLTVSGIGILREVKILKKKAQSSKSGRIGAKVTKLENMHTSQKKSKLNIKKVSKKNTSKRATAPSKVSKNKKGSASGKKSASKKASIKK